MVFVAAALLSSFLNTSNRALPATRLTVPSWLWPAYCVVGLVLFWPALSIGFLSDDFVLAQRALAWNVGAIGPAFWRPLPLLLWGGILRIGGGAATLHLLNVLLHGTNAFLTARMVASWARDRGAGLLAGLLVLTCPISAEAVVWCSGVFDVLTTTLILLCVAASRAYDATPTRLQRVAFFLAGLAAVLSKETGVLAGALVLLNGWIGQSQTRASRRDAWILLVVDAAFGLVRWAIAASVVGRPITRYVLQRWLFGTFGAVAVPWHVDVIDGIPWLSMVGSAAVIILVGLYAIPVRTKGRAPIRSVLGAMGWVLVGTAPTLTFLFVSPDLQNSRYVYQSIVGWAGLMVLLCANHGSSSRLPIFQQALIVVLILLGGLGIRLHLGPWQAAAAMRDEVENAAGSDPRMRACGVVSLAELPDSIRGAYVFRNGVEGAFSQAIGLTVAPARADCEFYWDGHSFHSHR